MRATDNQKAAGLKPVKSAIAVLEFLESRQLYCALHGGVSDIFDPTGRVLDADETAYVARVNFGPTQTRDVPGYRKDVGEALAVKPDTSEYGWTSGETLKGKVRQSAASPDDRYDSFLSTRAGSRWEMTIPNGNYVVRLAAGDVRGRSAHAFSVEGISAVNGKNSPRQKWLEATLTVAVADGRLTIESHRAGKLNFVDVSAADPGAIVMPEDLPAQPPADARGIPAGGASSLGTSVRWQTATPNPLARAEAIGNVINGKLYVMGGFNGKVAGTADNYIAVKRGDVYDPATNRWSRIADMPEAFTHATGVVVGDQLWFVGGYAGNHPGPGTTSVWKYDTGDNRWTRGPSLPLSRGAGGAGLIGNTLYFVGGMDRDRINDRNNLWALDTKKPSQGWVSLPSMPTARNHLSVVATGGKLYAISGQLNQEQNQVALAQVEAFDPATKQWSAAASIPAPRSHVTSAVFDHGGRIVVVGGEDGFNSVKRELFAYDPASNQWAVVGQLPSARSTMVAGVLPDGRIVASTGNSPVNTWTTWIGTPA
ncbi:Kelch repeat-containing protein [Humisphaera borealis]|uniref:Galactose oxidase n=1 Tax=Humisphaera borealis TaxID=2807512 RepID=A0A7M2WR26_9BACT|nr:kelch repeat-containing protein [Humisphaera borealis]QOV87926.1 hypothetical protein IPV69_16835 [Humisphaera borealis]